MSRHPGDLSYCGEQVRRYDPDRFLTALYAPPARRDALLTLYAFNLEIAKIRESVSEPMLGEIRLQWWREAVEEAYGGGPVRQHAIAESLAAVIRAERLSRGPIDRMIDARALDLGDEPPETLPALLRYAEATSSTLMRLALEVLGVTANDAANKAAEHTGIAWALVGLIRAMPHHLRQGRVYLPRDLEAEFRVDRRTIRELKPDAGLAAAVAHLAEVAVEQLAAARALRGDVPAAARPALLPATLADGYLARLRRARYDVFDPRLAARPGLMAARLAVAAFRGRY